MQWLQSLDAELFQLINLKLSNPVLDTVMPFVSGNRFFLPAAIAAASVLVWRGRLRGAVCVAMVVLVVALGDGLVSNTLKQAIGRPRPFLTLPEVHLPPTIGMGGSGSMPSSHAVNWFAATLVVLVYYRRSVWFMLPMAVVVGFSRVYNGVHYPSDVVAGAVLGAGCAGASLALVNGLWGWAGRRWFPLWWQAMPSVLMPEVRQTGEEAEVELPRVRGQAPAGFRSPHAVVDEHWVRLGYVLVAGLLLVRLAYLASGTIGLAEDEAYQWLWSKHLALSYYSKPPLIAYTQFLGTTLWGDNEFGVRFFSPIITAIVSLWLLRFFAREVNARAGFLLVIALTAAPLMSVGSILMTVDPLSVLFWTAAMLAGWRAVQPDASTSSWCWVGLWMGLGFLSKYTALFQWLCWAVFFALWPPARKHLRRPGPWVALLVNLLCALPVVIWNAQHDWVTVGHVADDAGARSAWHPTLRFVGDFLGVELLLLNPVFFVGAVWAAMALFRQARRQPLLVYFFSMGAPVFLAYLAHSFHSRVLPNWIAPSIVPLFCLMLVFWDARWRLGAAWVKGWFIAGLTIGLPMVVLCHNTDLVAKFTGHYLPIRIDPLHRVRGWDGVARAVNGAREELLKEGKPVFIICEHYGLVGEISFYLPEARADVRAQPLVYGRRSASPENQFYYWPGYSERKGENAIYVRQLDRYDPKPGPVPPELTSDFQSVVDLGVLSVHYHGQPSPPLRALQCFACRGLK